MKWGWWRGIAVYAEDSIYPVVIFSEYYPFWALNPPCVIVKPLWWGIN